MKFLFWRTFQAAYSLNESDDVSPQSGHLSSDDSNFGGISDDESIESLEIENEVELQHHILPEIEMENYPRDVEFEENYENDWCWLLQSDLQNAFNLPFTAQGGELNMNSDERSPEVFFQQLFDPRMWDEIAEI